MGVTTVGGLNFGFGRDVLLGIESGPIQIPIFEEKVNHLYTNRPNFGLNFEQDFLKFEPTYLAQIWKKKIENQPFQIPNFA